MNAANLIIGLRAHLNGTKMRIRIKCIQGTGRRLMCVQIFFDRLSLLAHTQHRIQLFRYKNEYRIYVHILYTCAGSYGHIYFSALAYRQMHTQSANTMGTNVFEPVFVYNEFEAEKRAFASHSYGNVYYTHSCTSLGENAIRIPMPHLLSMGKMNVHFIFYNSTHAGKTFENISKEAELFFSLSLLNVLATRHACWALALKNRPMEMATKRHIHTHTRAAHTRDAN